MHRWVEGDLNVRLRSCRFGVEYNDMHLLKVLEQRMQVRQVEPTACVIPALLVGGLSEASRLWRGKHAQARPRAQIRSTHSLLSHSRWKTVSCPCGSRSGCLYQHAHNMRQEETHSILLSSCAVGEPAGKRALCMPQELARHEMGEPRKWRVKEAGLNVPSASPPVYEPASCIA